MMEGPMDMQQEQQMSEMDAEMQSIVQTTTERINSEEEELLKTRLNQMSAAELLDALAVLLQNEELPARQEVEAYKTTFYRLKRNTEATEVVGESKSAELEAIEIQEERLRDMLSDFRELNQKRVEKIDEERRLNTERKKELIKRFEDLLTTSEEFGKISPIFHEIREEWRSIGAVSEPEANNLLRDYNKLVEQFYDLKQINDEFREYDFRKNLESKTALCEEAEALIEMPDLIQSFRKLQDLHNQWRDLGPVSREFRESIWTRFKAASTAINKRHQDFFEQRKQEEVANLEAKQALCEAVEALGLDSFKSVSQWSSATKKVLELQNKWKTIGFAPRKENDKIFRRFRAACDAYFETKSAFYSRLRKEQDENLQRKNELVNEAESLQDSTDWQKTADRLISLQKEWRLIGSVPNKYNETVWKRFRAACDTFFDHRKEARGSVYSTERENLKKKKGVIASLNELLKESNEEVVRKKLAGLTEEFRTIGHVTYKEKENIYNAYKQALDAVHEKFNISRAKRRLAGYNASIERMAATDKDHLYHERDKMFRILGRMRQELQTYTNNLGFLSISSGGGGGLLAEMERKHKNLERDIYLMEEKIAMLDSRIAGKVAPLSQSEELVSDGEIITAPVETPEKKEAIVIVRPEAEVVAEDISIPSGDTSA